MLRKILFFVVTLLLVFANIASASACIIGGYQPELPDALK